MRVTEKKHILERNKERKREKQRKKKIKNVKEKEIQNTPWQKRQRKGAQKHAQTWGDIGE